MSTSTALSPAIQAIEAQLHDLDEALAGQDPARLEASAQQLHRVLADALTAFRHAAAEGHEPMSADLRHRLSLAQTRVMQLQQNLHFAASSITRTLDVLLPRTDGASPSTSPIEGPRTVASQALNAYKG
jgi:Mg2+ and Co2+ transporter CorA